MHFYHKNKLINTAYNQYQNFVQSIDIIDIKSINKLHIFKCEYYLTNHSFMEFLELPNIEKNDLYLSINKTILIKVIIPLTVRKIRSNAFAFGENLEEIILYKGQEFIDDDSFEGCKKIMKLIIETNKNSNKSFIFEHMFYVE